MGRTYKEILDEMLEFEISQKMFEVEFNGVKIWNYVRWMFMRDIFREINGYREVFSLSGNEEIRLGIIDIIKKNIIYNTRFLSKKDILLVAHSRKIDEGKYKRDNVIYWIDRALEIPHYVLDYSECSSSYIRQESKNIKMFNFPTTNDSAYRVLAEEIDRKIYKPIEEEYGIKLSVRTKRAWLGSIEYILNSKNSLKRYFVDLLKRINPKIVVMAVSYRYENQVLCEVAKEKNIPIVELQHGQASSIHSAYNYKGKMNLSGFPDYFFCFGEFEKFDTRWPIDRKNVIPVGFPEMEYSLLKYPKVNTKKKEILFISAQPLEKIECAKKLSKLLDENNYEIIVKLHPMEIKYADKYIGLLERTAVRLISTFDKSIYYYLSRAEWVVGMESTVLYEATMFDVNVAILDGTKSDFAKPLIDNGYAVLVKNADELAYQIKKGLYKKDDIHFFYKKNSVENITRELKKILKIGEKL